MTNSNGTTFSVTITNSATENPATCTATVVVPAVDTPETVQPTKTAATPVQTLPVTSGDSSLVVAAIIAGIAVVGAALTVGGALLYRHFHTS